MRLAAHCDRRPRIYTRRVIERVSRESSLIGMRRGAGAIIYDRNAEFRKNIAVPPHARRWYGNAWWVRSEDPLMCRGERNDERFDPGRFISAPEKI